MTTKSDFHWMVSKTYFPSRRRVFGQRTKPHTFYQVFETVADALAFYRSEQPKVIGYKLSYRSVPASRYPLTNGEWIDERAPAVAAKRAQRRAARKEADTKSGFKAVRTHPTQTRYDDAREGAIVRFVHMPKGEQRWNTRMVPLLGMYGRVETKYPNTRRMINFFGVNMPQMPLLDVTQLEVIQEA